MSELTLSFVRLDPGLDPPAPATDGAAAVDLRSTRTTVIAPGGRTTLPTGLAVELPPLSCALVVPRSGLAARHGLTVTNAPGLIDPDYRGEISVLLTNLGANPVTIARGDRIAQLLIVPLPVVRWVEVPALHTQTARGSGGFGSTGTA